MFSALLLTLVVQSADSGLALRAVRFYRADPTQSLGMTQVTAMLRIPSWLPEAGARGEVSLSFAASVIGVAGDTLYQQSWQKRTAVPFPRGEADRLDILRFTLSGGSYRLDASVVDSVSGRRAFASVPVEGYQSQPEASDLLLSPWVRPVARVDTFPQPGEFRRGGLILAIAPEVVIGGPSASIAYFFETYSGAPQEGALVVSVVDADGDTRRRSEPTPVTMAAGIGLFTGQMEVGALGAGSYQLVTNLDLGGTTVTRSADFRLDPSAASAPSALTDEAYFETLPTAELNSAYEALAVIAPPGRLLGWPAAGSDQAKRAFLSRFWKPRDPTPETGNERRAQFYAGLIYANTFFPEESRGLEGWQTDRGRIFLREGLATQILRRDRRGPIPAYEVWRYFGRGKRFYVFVDRGAAGFPLIRTNDPREDGDRSWQEILTPEGFREIVGFLGRSVLTPGS